MKFTQSQRVLHDIQYNPPCNYYHVQRTADKKILHGTLAGPTVNSIHRNTFGYDKRFQQKTGRSLIPGPGLYFANKKQICYDFQKDLSNPKKFLKNTFRNENVMPSIPYQIFSQQNLDSQDQKFLKQLYLVQNPAKAAQSILRKEPVYSFSKSPRKLLPQIQADRKSKTNNFQQQKTICQQLQRTKQTRKNQLNGTFQGRNQNCQQNKKKLVIYNETIKKASKKRNQIINNISPDFVPSLELIDLMSKMRTKYVPGPGFYNTNLKNQFNSNLDAMVQSNKKSSIFSQVKRFPVDKISIVGPGSYDLQSQLHSNKGGLMSREKRALFNMKQKTDIEYRFYIDPTSQCKVQSNLQSKRSYSCASLKKRQLPLSFNGFGSGSQRFCIDSKFSQVQGRKRVVSEYEIDKKKQFKSQLKARIKRLNSQDRRSTKQDSGLLGISTMASAIQ